MLAVLLLLSLAGSLALPALDRGLREREVRQSALQLAALARELRGRAVDESALQQLVLSLQENSYRTSENKVFLPPEIRIAGLEGGEPLGERGRQFLFFPNGSLLGGRITVSSREARSSYSIFLDSLTGRVVVRRQ